MHCSQSAAMGNGRLAREITPVSVPQRKGEPIIVAADEHPRPSTTLEGLTKLRPIVREGGTVTAGNASGVNDGAAALILASEGAGRCDATSHRGLALRRPDGATLVRAEPDPQEPFRMTGTAGDDPPLDRDPVSDADRGPDHGAAGEQLEALIAAATREHPTARFVARWIGFDQTVVVARTGGRLVDDRRSGRRGRPSLCVNGCRHCGGRRPSSQSLS